MLLAHCQTYRIKAAACFIAGPNLASHRGANSCVPGPAIARSASTRPKRGKCGIDSRGFSLVELLIVMAVLLIISAIAIPHLVSALDSAKDAKAVGDIKTIETDVLKYESDNGALPDNLGQVGDGALLDPWKNPYQYHNNTDSAGNGILRQDRFLVQLNADYDLYSTGKDGQTAQPIAAATSQDDIIRVGSSGYAGLASQY